MAEKSRFVPELTEVEIDALVDNVLNPGVLIKHLFYSGLLNIK